MAPEQVETNQPKPCILHCEEISCNWKKRGSTAYTSGCCLRLSQNLDDKACRRPSEDCDPKECCQLGEGRQNDPVVFFSTHVFPGTLLFPDGRRGEDWRDHIVCIVQSCTVCRAKGRASATPSRCRFTEIYHHRRLTIGMLRLGEYTTEFVFSGYSHRSDSLLLLAEQAKLAVPACQANTAHYLGASSCWHSGHFCGMRF